MPTWHYSVKFEDESKIAKAVRYDIPVSIKYMREIAYTLKGMKLSDAIRFLEEVIKLKQPVPFRRYHGKLSHKRGLADRFKWPSGRYPVKGAKYALEVLRNVEANAENKGLDKSKLVIIHIAAHKGLTLKRYMPRAFGRATPKYRRMSHLEVIVGEVE
ncbi:MAG: 50S ribosomal protein L22 [Desulfurococcus sp.]|nr:50S ribosomal protein L22 [Desulfurococcus sp.]